MAIDVNAYVKELMDAAGLSDETQRKQLEGVFGSEKVRGKLHETLEGVERERGRTAAERKRAEDAEKARQRDYEENLKIFASNKNVVDEYQKQVRAYEDAYGPLGEAGKQQIRQNVQQDFIDKKAFDDRLKQTEGMAVQMAKIASAISIKHFKDFGEVLDLDEVEKIAIAQGKSAKDAYEEYARPKHEARQKEDFASQLQKAREEGALEERSRKAAGGVTDSTPASPFMANLRKSGQSQDSAKDSFLSGWREPAKGK